VRNLRYQPSKTGAQKLLAEKLRDEKISFMENQWLEGLEVDLFLPEYYLVIEIDGFYHLSAGQQAKDRQKDQRLQAAGYHVLRFTNSQIYQDSKACLHKIRAFIDGHDLQLKIGARPDDEQAPWQSKLAALKKRLDQEEE
jgi:very-short-patch-repair endonuclease